MAASDYEAGYFLMAIARLIEAGHMHIIIGGRTVTVEFDKELNSTSPQVLLELCYRTQIQFRTITIAGYVIDEKLRITPTNKKLVQIVLQGFLTDGFIEELQLLLGNSPLTVTVNLGDKLYAIPQWNTHAINVFDCGNGFDFVQTAAVFPFSQYGTVLTAEKAGAPGLLDSRVSPDVPLPFGYFQTKKRGVAKSFATTRFLPGQIIVPDKPFSAGKLLVPSSNLKYTGELTLLVGVFPPNDYDDHPDIC